MRIIKTIEGKKYGKLTVLGYDAINIKKHNQVCECDCGTIITVRKDAIVSGHTKSCGCYKIEKAHDTFQDITGQRFGRLNIVKLIGYRGKYLLYECLCDCGTIKNITAHSLRIGSTLSCGCLNRDNAYIKTRKLIVDLSGKTFGRLSVLERLNGVGSKYRCKCSCGKEIIAEHSNLQTGNTKSCGCYATYVRKSNCKDRASNWRGGISTNNHIIRNSSEMSIWRKSIFERDNYTCIKCGERGGKLRAHHLNSFANYPDLRLVIDNGVTLCDNCHRQFHRECGRKDNTSEQFEQWLEDSIDL